MPHTTLLCSRFSSGSEHSNEPIGADVGAHHDGRERAGIEGARPAGHLRVAEAVEGQRRLEYVVFSAEDEAVGRLGAAQRPDAELIVLDHLGVPKHDLGAGRAA